MTAVIESEHLTKHLGGRSMGVPTERVEVLLKLVGLDETAHRADARARAPQRRTHTREIEPTWPTDQDLSTTPVEDGPHRRGPVLQRVAHLRRRPDRLLIDPRERGAGPRCRYVPPCRSRRNARCSGGRPYLDAHGSPIASSGSTRDSPRVSSSSHRSKEQHMTSIAPQGLRAPNSPGRGSDTNLPEETS